MKQNILNFKNEIKALVKEQKVNKLNRKTDRLPENFVRTKPAWQAAEDANSLKYTLECAYMAYAILRGKDDEFLSRIDNDWEYIKSCYQTSKFIDKYGDESPESAAGDAA